MSAGLQQIEQHVWWHSFNMYSYFTSYFFKIIEIVAHIIHSMWFVDTYNLYRRPFCPLNA